ncbi:MAG: hypothetical protein ACI4G1_03590 [Ruminococcus sp.]
MKKFISIILAVAMIALSSVTAFAYTDADIGKIKQELNNLLSEIKTGVIKDYTTPYDMIDYSDNSVARATALYDEIVEEKGDYTTYEEYASAIDRINEMFNKLTVSPYYLKWLLDYVQKDLNSEGYYDDATKAQLVEIYNKSKEALENGTEEEIHCAFVDMYNEFKRLCIYNDVAGDVNGDGVTSILDVSLMQMYFAKSVELNTSQRFTSDIYVYSTIDTVSTWQQVLAKYVKHSQSFDISVEKMKKQADFPYNERRLATIYVDYRNDFWYQEISYIGPIPERG